MNARLNVISLAALPALGAALEGGTFRGVTTLKDGSHVAVVLLPNKPQERLNWQDAVTWAEQQGGQLPSRPVSALLYANAKDQFEPKWYWTSEQLQDDTGDEDDASFAWHCYFGYGTQSYTHKSFKAAAVAVRMIPLTA